MTEFSHWLDAAFDLAPMVFDALFAIVAFASAITAMTRTPRDDDWVGALYRIVEVLALNIGRAKQTPPNRTGGRFTAP